MHYASRSDRHLAVLAFTTHPVVPLLARCRRGDVTSADDEVTEPLAFQSLKRIVLDHGAQDGKNLRLRDSFYGKGLVHKIRQVVMHLHTPVDLVETLAIITTTEEHQVRPWGLAYECNL